jgi:lysophospholipid acyltransferase (LPLAT)-like uncharacterized protein
MLTSTQQLKARLIAGTATPVVAALGRTWTWRVEGAHYYDALVHSGRSPILALWHGRILAATLYWRDRGIVALTSQNFDGEWIARLMARFGYRAARGSTSRGGARGLVQLRRQLATGATVAFTVDGPRGPARQAQRGAVWLAGATGHPVLPFHIEADRYWQARSWDRTQIPKPFSTVVVAIGEPFEVPATDDEILEANRVDLERRLFALERKALGMVNASPAGTEPRDVANDRPE